MTTTARILQSHGLNANKSAILARELGLTDDTEQPVIGSTVGGAKYLGTEDFISIITAAPAAVAILRRSFVTISCDLSTAGASIALDIRNGAQVAGYRCLVFSLGTDTRQTVVEYATGVLEYIPSGCSQEFVWSGAAWLKTRTSWAEKYLMGDMLVLPYKPTTSVKLPVIDRSIDQDITAAQFPTAVPVYRAIKCSQGGVEDFAVTVVNNAPGAGQSTIEFPNTVPANAILTAIQNEATVAKYLNTGEIANFLGGTDYATAATRQTVDCAGVTYFIDACDLVTRKLTVTGLPTAGAQTASVYAYRIAGSTTSARLLKLGGFIPAPQGDSGAEMIAGKRKMDRIQGHRHGPLSTSFWGSGAGVGVYTPGAGALISDVTTGNPTNDTVNGATRTGKNTDPREIAQWFVSWAGVFVA